MKIAITGSSGFIGKHLRKMIQEKHPEFEVIEMDLTNGIDLLDPVTLGAIPSFDTVVHLAGKSFVPDSFKNPHSFYYANVNSTLNVLELCRRNSARMILFSSYVYGTPQHLPIDEKHPINAFNPYAQSKLMCEELCKGYHRDFKVPALIFRPFNIYGPGQNESFLIPEIIAQIKSGKKHILLKDSRPRRDFVHVTDVANAVCKAITSNFDFDILNIASGTSYSVKELSEIVKKEASDPDLEFHFDASVVRPNEVLETVGSKEKINKVLNWEPLISLQEGIRLYLKK